MKAGKALAYVFGAAAIAAVGVIGFGQVNEDKLYECSPPGVPLSAEVVKWRLTGGYGLGIVNADSRIAYAENNEAREPLQQKAEQFCRDRTLNLGPE